MHEQFFDLMALLQQTSNTRGICWSTQKDGIEVAVFLSPLFLLVVHFKFISLNSFHIVRNVILRYVVEA